MIRLVLGDKQAMNLLVALSWAIDSYASSEEDDDMAREEARQIKEWRRLQEKLRTARYLSHTKADR